MHDVITDPLASGKIWKTPLRPLIMMIMFTWRSIYKNISSCRGICSERFLCFVILSFVYSISFCFSSHKNFLLYKAKKSELRNTRDTRIIKTNLQHLLQRCDSFFFQPSFSQHMYNFQNLLSSVPVRSDFLPAWWNSWTQDPSVPRRHYVTIQLQKKP